MNFNFVENINQTKLNYEKINLSDKTNINVQLLLGDLELLFVIKKAYFIKKNKNYITPYLEKIMTYKLSLINSKHLLTIFLFKALLKKYNTS